MNTQLPIGTTVYVNNGGNGAYGANGMTGKVVPNDTPSEHGKPHGDLKVRMTDGSVWAFNRQRANLSISSAPVPTEQDFELFASEKRRKEQLKKWFKWRKRVAQGLPELSQRVFALRTTNNPADQSELEFTLGKVIAGATAPSRRFLEHGEDAGLTEQLLLEIDVEELYKNLKDAEAAD